MPQTQELRIVVFDASVLLGEDEQARPGAAEALAALQGTGAAVVAVTTGKPIGDRLVMAGLPVRVTVNLTAGDPGLAPARLQAAAGPQVDGASFFVGRPDQRRLAKAAGVPFVVVGERAGAPRHRDVAGFVADLTGLPDLLRRIVAGETRFVARTSPSGRLAAPPRSAPAGAGDMTVTRGRGRSSAA